MSMKGETVSVIMPVYNEERTLKAIVSRVLAQRFVDELIIVDDFSSDGTPKIIAALAGKNKRIRAIRNRRNMGKGYSVRAGLKIARDGIIIIQDADLEYYPEDYAAMIKALGPKNFVLGRRTLQKSTGHRYALSAFANDLFSMEFNIMYGTSIKDINTCYKVFRKSMIDVSALRANDFRGDPEILVNLVRNGYSAREVLVRYRGRTFAEGKKINAKDAVKQGAFILWSRISGK